MVPRGQQQERITTRLFFRLLISRGGVHIGPIYRDFAGTRHQGKLSMIVRAARRRRGGDRRWCRRRLVYWHVTAGGKGLVAVPFAGSQAAVGLVLPHHSLLAFSCQTVPPT